MKCEIVNNIVRIDGEEFAKEMMQSEDVNEIIERFIDNQETMLSAISGLNAANSELRQSLNSLHKKIAEINLEQRDKVTEKTMKRGNNIAYVIASLMFVVIILQLAL